MDDLEFLMDAMELKNQERAWIDLFGVEKSESVAGHSWGAAFLVVFYSSDIEDVDREKAVKMALVHDLAESEIGDIAYADHEEKEISNSEKRSKEKEIWECWEDELENDEIVGLWEEYEKRESSEARFVKDMDLIDLCLQALRSERNDKPRHEAESKFESFDELLENSRKRLNTETGKELFRKIEERYEEVKDEI